MNKLSKPLSFQWDKGNIDRNFKKHKVADKELEDIFEDENLKILKDFKHSRKEERFFVYGKTREKRKLHIVFTIRNWAIRIISARDMSKKERRFYEKT